MKLPHLCMLLFLMVSSIAANAQNDKKIPGTLVYGCRSFNYLFVKQSNGTYTFRIEDIDKEDAIIYLDNKELLHLKKHLVSAIDSIDLRAGKIDSAGWKTRHIKDSVLLSLGRYVHLIDNIRAGKLSLSSWYSASDSIQALFKKNKVLKLDSLVTDYAALVKLGEKVDSVSENVMHIVNERTYTLADFEKASFTTLLINLLKLRNNLLLPECKSGINFDEKASDVFYSIKGRLEILDDEPTTAWLRLKKRRLLCYGSSSDKLQVKASDDAKPIGSEFIVESVSAEFEDGAIKNLFVDLRFADSALKSTLTYPIRFKNVFPISVSSRNDAEKFGLIKIFAGNLRDFKDILVKDTDKVYAVSSLKTANVIDDIINKPKPAKEKKVVMYFLLSDLLDYSISAASDNEDYSPANKVYTLSYSNPIAELKKERRSQILTVRAYSDLVGIKDDQPNGLIQIEALKRINLNAVKGGAQSVYVGMATYLEPRLTFSKIENNNKAFVTSYKDLDSSVLNSGRKAFFVNNIDLWRHQNASFDLDFNFYKINVPAVKSNFQFNLSAGIFRTSISDTIDVKGTNAVKAENVNINTVNSLRYGISIIHELKPDSRYGVTIGYDIRAMRILSNDYNFNESPLSVSTFWLNAFLKTNDENKLFFRYRFSYLNSLPNHNFMQIQLGYSMDLFKTNKK